MGVMRGCGGDGGGWRGDGDGVSGGCGRWREWWKARRGRWDVILIIRICWRFEVAVADIVEVSGKGISDDHSKGG